jgi:hypothetical protein
MQGAEVVETDTLNPDTCQSNLFHPSARQMDVISDSL